MSTTFTLWCDLCEVDGPQLHRSAGGMQIRDWKDKWYDGPTMPEFLIEHERHELRLRHD